MHQQGDMETGRECFGKKETNNLADVAMDVDIPEAALVEVIEDTVLPNSQNEVTLDKDVIASESSEVAAQTATMATGHDYKALIETYAWDGCQTVQLKNGHVLYIWIHTNYNLNDATKKLLYYMAPENQSKLNSSNISGKLRQMHRKVQSLKSNTRYTWTTLVSLVQADFIIPSVQRRTLSDGEKFKKMCNPLVQNQDTSDEVEFTRRRPMNAEIVRVEECSRCLFMKGEMSNYRKRIQGFRTRLSETRKELAATKKIYNIKRMNQKIKRKNNIIQKCKKAKRDLRLEIFSLQRENKKLKKQCERFLKKERGKKWGKLRSMVKHKQDEKELVSSPINNNESVNLSVNDKESVGVRMNSKENVTSGDNDQVMVNSLIHNTEKCYKMIKKKLIHLKINKKCVTVNSPEMIKC